MTLAGHTTFWGARIYTKDMNGECREAQNNTSTSKITAGVRDQKPGKAIILQHVAFEAYLPLLGVVDTSEGWFASRPLPPLHARRFVLTVPL
jgi:hypothetical protein